MYEKKELPKTHLLKLAAVCAALGFAYASSDARGPLCDWTIATTSIYFVPHIKDYCPTSNPCPKFRRQVRMQGSGTLPGNRVLTYQGKIKSLGSCETAVGAAGKCLKPYISVAADPRYYNMGDIIQMPSMKGRVMTLPNGKIMTHPGYFIVEDVGGAIKGPNRFDFFTGSAGLTNTLNSFGTKGSPASQLQDVSDCSPRKSFGFMRRGSLGNKVALAAIDKAIDDATPSRAFASRSTAGAR
jgi:3D (Asp-Asp-Asp) domain-containing protein